MARLQKLVTNLGKGKLDAGEPYPASVLFPRDANKRIALVWRDSVNAKGRLGSGTAFCRPCVKPWVREVG